MPNPRNSFSITLVSQQPLAKSQKHGCVEIRTREANDLWLVNDKYLFIFIWPIYHIWIVSCLLGFRWCHGDDPTSKQGFLCDASGEDLKLEGSGQKHHKLLIFERGIKIPPYWAYPVITYHISHFNPTKEQLHKSSIT